MSFFSLIVIRGRNLFKASLFFSQKLFFYHFNLQFLTWWLFAWFGISIFLNFWLKPENCIIVVVISKFKLISSYLNFKFAVDLEQFWRPWIVLAFPSYSPSFWRILSRKCSWTFFELYTRRRVENIGGFLELYSREAFVLTIIILIFFFIAKLFNLFKQDEVLLFGCPPTQTFWASFHFELVKVFYLVEIFYVLSEEVHKEILLHALYRLKVIKNIAANSPIKLLFFQLILFSKLNHWINTVIKVLTI